MVFVFVELQNAHTEKFGFVVEHPDDTIAHHRGSGVDPQNNAFLDDGLR